MSRQQMLLLGIAVSLVVFFLVGCGSGAPTAVSEAPAATSAPEQAAATPEQPPTATPVPPTATPVPPTSTPEPPTATPTPEPPTPTPTPAGNLTEGATLVLGAAEVKVGKVSEATTISINDTSAQGGMKFIITEIEVNKLESGQEFATDRLVLETVAGKQYDKPGAYAEVRLGRCLPRPVLKSKRTKPV